MKLKSFGIRLRLLLKKFIIDVRHTHLKDLRNSFLSSLKKLPDVVHLKNLVLFGSILCLFTLALFVQRFASLRDFYFIERPDFGGSYSQGVVGSIDKINPLFIQNDAEKAANLLVYSGLTRTINGTQIIPDLAESWEVKDSGKSYAFKLHKDVKWHDDIIFTADDVIYTIGLIQNADTKSGLESVWKGVLVEKVSDYEVKFTLPSAYPGFLAVTNQAILPSHLLSTVDPKNVKIAEFNLNPVGTGPYKFTRFDQLGNQLEAIFTRNERFQISRPYLDQIKLVMYDDSASEFQGLARKQIDGVFAISAADYRNIDQLSGINILKKLYPDFQVVFFNLRNPILADRDLRVSLSSAIDREELVSKVLLGQGLKQSAPLVPGQSGFDPKVKGIEYNADNSNTALDKAGWVKGTDGIRAKEGKRLVFRLVYSDSYEASEDAKLLKSQLNKVGVSLELISSNEDQVGANYIRPRNFDLLLFNQNVGLNQDWYSLWGSSQVNSPGLNLSGFADKKLDRFVEQVRSSSDDKYRAERMKQVEQILIEQAPAIYLYRPIHLSGFSQKIKGIDQSKLSSSTDILSNVYLWYQRVKG